MTFDPHPGRLAGLFCASLLCLTGCQGFPSAAADAHLRVIDASPDAGTVDFYRGNTALAYNLGYGAVSSYIALAPGTSTITVDAAGSRQVLSSVSGTFAAAGQYTLLLKNPAANLQSLLLADPPPPQPAEPPSLRLLHQASLTGAVDLYLVPAGRRIDSVAPLLLDFASGAATAYLPLPAGPATLIMLPAGTAPPWTSHMGHTGTQIDFLPGSRRTVVLLDAPPTLAEGFHVIVTLDTEAGN